MKDYSLDKEEAKYFILNYEVKGEQIILHLAKNKQYIIPYSLENERKVLQKMREQIINSTKFEKKIKGKIRFSKYFLFVSPIVYIFAVVFFSLEGALIFLRILLFSLPFNVAYFVFLKNKIIFNNLQKNKLFIEYGKEIHEFVQSHSFNLSKLSLSAKNAISHCDLNNIDHISYGALKVIEEQMHFEEYFNFDFVSEENIVEENSDSVVKKYGMKK